MKFEQLIADSQGRLTYGLDAAGNVWALGHHDNDSELWAMPLETVDTSIPADHPPVTCSNPGCEYCANGVGHE